MNDPTPGQRIECLLNRGMADEWIAGTVREGWIELDEEPPGMTTRVTMEDVAEWRVKPFG